KIVYVRRNAMRWQNHETFAARVDEGHHCSLVGRVCIDRASLRAALVAIVEGSFVTMMTVCDDEFLIHHRGLNCGNFLGIGNDPEAMDDIVFVADFGCG